MKIPKKLRGWVVKLLAIAIILPLMVSHSTPLQVVSQESSLQVVSSTTEWKYRQDNVDPAIGTQALIVAGLLNGWTMPSSPFTLSHEGQDYDAGYDDSGWLSGPGPFGFKTGNSTHLDCNTILEHNIPGTTSRIPTYFFRTTFTLSDPTEYNELYYALRYDDAVIIYINGVEIGRHNTPTAGYPQNISYGCITGPWDYNEVVATINDTSMLRAGENVVSVALHQQNATSSDIYLNFMELSLNVANEFKAVSITPGANESQLNFAWYSLSSSTGKVEISDGTETNVFVAEEAPEPAPGGLYSNKVNVTGLRADTAYTYRIANGAAWSSSYEIKTGKSDTFSFLFAGDPQIGAGGVAHDVNGWKNTLTKSLSSLGRIDFLISAGDQVETSTNEAHYDGYFEPIQLMNLPVATSVGNHDNAENYKYHFNLPNLDNTKGYTAAGGNYYFTYNNVLFMMINSNNQSGAEHKLFMEDAIEANPDALWRIVVFHHSIYSTAYHSHTPEIINRRNNWVPVFDELGIDIVLMGHDHSYTRTYQMKGNNIQLEQTVNDQGQLVDPTGIIYLTANSASGSKYYTIREQEWFFAAITEQLRVPTISKIDMTEDTFTFKTYRVDTMAMVDSYSILKTNTVNRALLKTALDNANALDLSIYTKESADAYEVAISTAQAVYDDTDATQSMINAALSALKAAVNDLVALPDKTLLTELVNTADSLIAERYTQESFEAMTEPLAAAKTVVSSEDATEDQIEQAYNDLYSAISELVLVDSPEVKALEDAITIADDIDLSKYYESNKQVFIDTLSTAKAALVYGDMTFEELTSLTEKLLNDMQALVLIPDKDALQALVDECKKIDKSLYTSQSVTVFTSALSAAEAALEAENAQEQVNQAYETLKQAKEALAQKTADAPKVGDSSIFIFIFILGLSAGCILIIYKKRCRVVS